MRDELTVITPTGDRPEAFALCERWMSGQTLRGWHWLVSDDGEIETPITSPRITVIRRAPRPGVVTLADNLLALLPRVKTGLVAIVEDDDWYSHWYLDGAVSDFRRGAQMVGDLNAKYFNVASRRWWQSSAHTRHASLFRTAFRAELIPTLADVCVDAIRENAVDIDIRFWTHPNVAKAQKSLPPWRGTTLGIKGLPGRNGAGTGHLWNNFPNRDPDLTHLTDIVGAKDASAYVEFANREYLDYAG